MLDCLRWSTERNMDDLARLQGNEATESVDLTDDDQPGSAERGVPAAKKLRLQHSQHTSSGSSAVGRPTGSLWPFFTKSAQKQNKSHYGAFCIACIHAGTSTKILGVSDAMKGAYEQHLWISSDAITD